MAYGMQQYNPAPEELNLPSNHPHKGQSINRTFPKDSAVCITNMIVVSTGPSVPVRFYTNYGEHHNFSTRGQLLLTIILQAHGSTL